MNCSYIEAKLLFFIHVLPFIMQKQHKTLPYSNRTQKTQHKALWENKCTMPE
jgi:hypothetical protein